MNKTIRNQFPSLQRKHNKKSIAYLDGPAGVQVPNKVIDAISNYYKTSNANSHGYFITAQETDELLETTRETVATFLGAEGGHTISFGQNMTTLNYSLARAIGRFLKTGDEIVITQLDHESNRGPWLSLESEGIVVREVSIKGDGTLDYYDFKSKVNEKTKLVAMGYASNISGAVNDVETIRKVTHQVGAWLLLDAVHYAPHFSIDVQKVGCDFLLCSAYKFYGPHVGLLYARPGLLDRLPTDRLRTTDQHAPYSIETGTLNHAAIAGVKASIEFIASTSKEKGLRNQLVDAMSKIGKHERDLAIQLYQGLNKIKKIRVMGPTFKSPMRAPTISFIVEGKTPKEVCTLLAKENIFGWAGHFYALRAVEVLGLLEKGGVTRLGMSVYSTSDDVKRTLEVLSKI